MSVIHYKSLYGFDRTTPEDWRLAGDFVIDESGHTPYRPFGYIEWTEVNKYGNQFCFVRVDSGNGDNPRHFKIRACDVRSPGWAQSVWLRFKRSLLRDYYYA